MNTVTVEDLGDLGLYSLQPERQRSAVAKLTMVNCTAADLKLLLKEARDTCSDQKIALAIISKLLNGPLQDIATAIQQLRAREERRTKNPTLNPTYEENERRVRAHDQEWEEEQRRKLAGEAAETERKRMPWERMRRVD